MGGSLWEGIKRSMRTEAGEGIGRGTKMGNDGWKRGRRVERGGEKVRKESGIYIERGREEGISVE